MNNFIKKAFFLPPFFSLLLLLTSCEQLFQYNSNEIILSESEKDLTNKNLARIARLPVGDTVRFIFMADTQRWYDETEEFVASANRQNNVSFVLHGGDISDFGLTQEFKWVNEIMLKLKYPYLTVIGNHDLIANGPTIYKRMFGEFDYSFEFGDNKFVLINTNSREYAFDGSIPNLSWLRSQLSDNKENKNLIVVAHVPPFDADFDPELEKQYSQILASDPNVKFTLYGHRHSFYEGDFYNDGVQYYLTTAMQKRGYFLISTWKGGYNVERILF